MSKMYGNFGRVNIYLRNLQRASTKTKSLMGVGEVLAEQIRRNIESQLINFTPLSAAYAKRKAAEGGDPRILIDSGQFVKSIMVRDVQQHGDTFSIIVGVADGVTDTGIPLSELANWIENGTTKQPGRHPFAISWDMMKDRLSQDIVNRIKVELEEGL